MIEKVPPAAGGVPSPDSGGADAGKALIADNAGGYTWDSFTATLPAVTADDVSFNNANASIPNNPDKVQSAIEEAYKRIPATKVVKLPENTGGEHGLYHGIPVIREDGQMVYYGDRHHPDFGNIMTAGYISAPNGYGIPAEVNLPEFGRKVHQIVCGRWGVMAIAGSELNPRSEVWVSGHEMGSGSSGQVTTPTRVYTATTSGERVKQIFSNNFYSHFATHWYLRDDGKLYAAGHRSHYQLGTGDRSDSRQMGFVISQSGALTYAGGQKVTRIFSTGLCSWAEVTTDDTTYKLLAVGYNHIGQLGINVTGSTNGGINNSATEWAQCKKAQPSLSDMESVGGPFRKIIATEDDPNYRAAVFVITHDKKLYHTGRALGGGTNSILFTLVDENVEDVAATGGDDGSFIYCKTDGTAKVAGFNESYCHGDGTLTDVPIASPATISIFSPSLKAVECYGAYGSAWHQFLIRTEDGRVYGAGANYQGSLGVYSEVPDNESVVPNANTWKKVYLPEPIKAGGVYMITHVDSSNSYFIGESGTLYGCGSNHASALGASTADLTSTSTPFPLYVPNGQWVSGRWDFLNT